MGWEGIAWRDLTWTDKLHGPPLNIALRARAFARARAFFSCSSRPFFSPSAGAEIAGEFGPAALERRRQALRYHYVHAPLFRHEARASSPFRAVASPTIFLIIFEPNAERMRIA